MTVPLDDKAPSTSRQRRSLFGAGFAHALHDGYTDAIYVLLPIWQAEFGLSFSALAALRGLYSGTMAALQIPAGRLSERLGGRAVLVGGTFLAALGYALAGLSGGLIGLCVALAVGGAGSATQHPPHLRLSRTPTARGRALPLEPTTSLVTLAKPLSLRWLR